MISWPTIPADARAYLRQVFAEANRNVSERMLNVPNIRETSLDDGLVESLVPHSAPRRLSSGAIVKMQIHNIGGLRRYGRWETADIAVVILVYRGNSLVARKVGLLQSKRLYPENHDVEDDDATNFDYGLNRFLLAEPNSAVAKVRGHYRFTEKCEYAALKGGDQAKEIDALNAKLDDAVYYLLYNPPKIPISIEYPISFYRRVKGARVGCRILSAASMNSILAALPPGKSPTFGAVQSASSTTNWRLEKWIDLLLLCKVGHQFDSGEDDFIGSLLVRRTGPIASAIAVSIVLSEE